MRTIFARLPEALRWGVGTWLVGRLFFTVMGSLLWYTGWLPRTPVHPEFYHGVTPITAGWQGALWGVWQRWDALHYSRIAAQGYQTDHISSAFSPLYPLLGGGISVLTGLPVLPALLLVSDIAFIGFATLLFHYVTQRYSSSVARRTLGALLLFPYSFFLFAPYADGLAAFFALLALTLAQRGRWHLAFIAGFAAGLTQPMALALTLPLLWLAWETWRIAPKQWSVLGVALGPGLGMGLFLLWRNIAGFGDYITLYGNWGRGLHWPWESFFALPLRFTDGAWLAGGWLDAAMFVVQIVVGWLGYKYLPRPAQILFWGSIAYLLVVDKLNAPFGDWGRHSLAIFPFFILLPHIFAGRLTQRVYWAVSFALLLWLALLFFMWLPV